MYTFKVEEVSKQSTPGDSRQDQIYIIGGDLTCPNALQNVFLASKKTARFLPQQHAIIPAFKG